MEFRGKSIFFLLVISTFYAPIFTQRSHAELKNDSSSQKTTLFDLDYLEIITKQYYKSLETQITDIHSFVEKISNDVERIDQLRQNLRYPADYNTRIIDEFQSMGIILPEPEALAEINSTHLFKSLGTIQNGVYILADWYQLLTTMRSKLTEYSSQQNKDTLKDTELYRECSKDSPITRASLGRFYRLIDSLTVQDTQDTLQDKYWPVEFVEIDAPKKQALCKMLNLSLNSTVTTSCLDGGRMQVRGDVVKLSDITSFCPGDLKVLEIFALTTVHLDRDLKGRNFDVAIVAPNWKVVGEQSCYAAMSFYNWSSEFKDWLCTPNEKNKHSLFWFLRCENPMLKEYSSTLYAEYCSEWEGDDHSDKVLAKNPNARLSFFYDAVLADCYSSFPVVCDLTSRGNSAEDPLQEITSNYTSATDIRRVIDLSAEGVEPYPKMRVSWEWLDVRYMGMPGKPGEPGKPGGNFLGIFRDFSGMQELMVITDGGRGGAGKMGHYGAIQDDGRRGRGGDGGRGGIGGIAGKVILVQVKKAPKEVSPMVFNVRSSNGTNGVNGFGGLFGGSSLDTQLQEGGLPGKTRGNAKDIKLPEKAVPHWRVPSIVNEYKEYLLDHLDDRWRKSALTNMYTDLSNSQEIEKDYESLDYADELVALEDKFLKLENTVDLTTFYEALDRRFDTYVEKTTYNVLFKHIYEYWKKRKIDILIQAVLSSKLCALQEPSRDRLVVNIRKYLHDIIEDLKEVRKSKDDIVVDSYSKSHQEETGTMIPEANRLIHTVVLPEETNIIEKIDNRIHTLLTGSESDNQKALANTLLLKEAATLTKGVTSVLSTFANTAPEFNEFFETIRPTNETLQSCTEENNCPSDVEDLFSATSSHLQQLAKQKQEILGKLLETLSEDKAGVLDDLKTSVKLLKYNVKVVFLNSAWHTLKVAINFKKETLSSNVSNNQDALALLDRLQDELKVAVHLPGVFLKYKRNPTALSALIATVKEQSKHVMLLKDYQNEIDQAILGLFENVEANVRRIVYKLNTETLSSLDLVRFRTTNFVKDLLNKVDPKSVGSVLKNDLEEWMINLERAMDLVANVYRRKDGYIENIGLKQYADAIRSPYLQNIQTSNETVDQAVSTLRSMVQSNIVFAQYQRAVGAFKQYVFPFVHLYNELRPLKYNSYKLPVAFLVQNAMSRIVYLKTKMENSSQNLFKNYTRDLKSADFVERSSYGIGSFYTWKNESHSDILSRLLSGEKITLKADLSKSLHDKNAVRFNRIGIKFVPADPSLSQSELDEKLRNFEARLTHLGKSYFKCDDQCYVMDSKYVTVNFNFTLNDAEEYVGYNTAYEKIGEGDFVLSPYALWAFELHAEDPQHFKDLLKYKNKVDMQLQGRGKYVDGQSRVCDVNKLGYFYQQTACA